LLLKETGKTLLEHTWEAACRCKRADAVWVATDSEEIWTAATAFGAEAIITTEDHASGTSRMAEAARAIKADLYVNWQADEPMLDPEAVDNLIAEMQTYDYRSIMTLATPLRHVTDYNDESIVKVLTDVHGRAVTFTRKVGIVDWSDVYAAPAAVDPWYQRHIGLYAFTRDKLRYIAEEQNLGRSRIERAERLEQMTWVVSGHEIHVQSIPAGPHGIDTQAQYDEFVRLVKHAQAEYDAFVRAVQQ